MSVKIANYIVLCVHHRSYLLWSPETGRANIINGTEKNTKKTQNTKQKDTKRQETQNKNDTKRVKD